MELTHFTHTFLTTSTRRAPHPALRCAGIAATLIALTMQCSIASAATVIAPLHAMISGSAVEGGVLSGKVNTLSPVTWTWIMCKGLPVVCTPIPAASSASLHVTASALGSRIFAQATPVSATTAIAASSNVTLPVIVPTPTAIRIPAVLLNSSFRFSWQAPVSETSFWYDIQDAATPPGQAPVAPTLFAQRISNTDVSLSPTNAGITNCLQVRSHDQAGNVSAWTAPTCTTRPFDDSLMTATSSWTRAGLSSAYNGTLTTVNNAAGTLTTTTAYGRSINIVAPTCATCGIARVWWNRTLLGYVSFRSTLTGSSPRVIATFRIPVAAQGKVSIETAAGGGLVQIDAIAVTPI